MPETAKRTARVPILGEDGRISDDYVPAAIGEGVEAAEAAATRAETAATAAGGSATAASQSATQAASSASAASTSAAKAQESAATAGGAVTQAQSAQAAAEKAKTDAESARDSAKTAASQAQRSATAAADSAANVADKFIASAQATTLEPGSQATASVADQVLTLGIPRGDKGDKGDTGEKGDPGDVSAVQTAEGSDLSVSTVEGTVTIDDSALRARISELENQAANVLKGAIGPAPLLSADDAYATKPRKLTVHGETRQNLWANPSGTQNGVTVTANDDGSLTVSGTSTTETYISGGNIYGLKPSTQYTVKSNAAAQGFNFILQVCGSDGSYIDSLSSFEDAQPHTFTTPAEFSFARFFVHAMSGFTVSGTYRVMLNEGDTAEPWCPPGLNSVDELSIVTAGKNLLDIPDMQKITGFGGPYTFTLGDDGSVTCSPTPDQRAWSYKTANVKMLLPAGTYTLSLSISEYVSGCGIRAYRSDETLITQLGLDDETYVFGSFTLDAPTEVGIIYKIATAKGYPQLEFGSTATAYEPPVVTTTPIDLDGNTLCSLPDGTHDELTIDATGAVTLTKRVGSVTLSSNAGDWKKDPAGSRYSMRISPEAHHQYTPGSVISDALPYRKQWDNSYTDTHIIAVAGATYASVGTDETAQDIADVCGGKKLLYTLAEPQTISLPSVTLPTLPAPTVNVWADAEASGAGYAMDPDVELEYERDVTIAFNKLQAQVSATTVREATNG